MDSQELYLKSLRRLLARMVVVVLAAAWIAWSYFRGSDRAAQASEVLAFVHLFMPVWAIAFHAYARRRLGVADIDAGLCRKCGYDLSGFGRDQCPECGRPVARRRP